MSKDTSKSKEKTIKKVKQPRNWDWLNTTINFLIHSIAYIWLFTLASYGCLRLLDVLNETIKVSLTVSFIFLLVVIIFKKK